MRYTPKPDDYDFWTEEGEECPTCCGTGEVNVSDYSDLEITCPECDGTGFRPVEPDDEE